MTENEYINTKDLGSVICVKECLKKIIPESSNIISKKEHEEVTKIVSRWEIELYQKIILIKKWLYN